MATTYPETVRISRPSAAIRVSMPPDAGRLGVAARVLGPFTESSPSEQFHGWFVAAGVAVTVVIGLLAWPELATIGDAILYLAP